MKTSIIKSRSVVTVSMLVIHVTLGCGLPSRERLPAQETARPTSPKLPPADKTSNDAYGQCMLAARETMVRMQIQIDSKTLQEIMELCRKGDLERATAVVKSIHALRYERCKQNVHAYIRSKGYTVVPEPFVDHINRFCDYGDSRRAITAIAQHEKRYPPPTGSPPSDAQRKWPDGKAPRVSTAPENPETCTISGRVDGRLQQEEMLTDGRGRPTGQRVTRVLTQMGLLTSDGGQLVSTTQLNDLHYRFSNVESGKNYRIVPSRHWSFQPQNSTVRCEPNGSHTMNILIKGLVREG
jgi:hypothetical protein